jgi:cell division protein ZipA
MDMSLRGWLAIAGLIILTLILIDGYRRVKRARKDSLEMSIEMGGEIENSPIDEHFNPELPNGGARIVGRASTQEEEIKQASYLSDENRQEPWIGQEDSPLEESDSYIDNPDQYHHQETPLYAENAFEHNDFAQHQEKTDLNKSFNEMESEDVERAEVETSHFQSDAPAYKQEEQVSSYHSDKDREQKQTTHQSKMPNPQEVIVINVLNHTANGFKGSDLKALFEACGMVYGDMSIFHRHEEDSLDSPIQFSVANAVKPGYFPADELETMQTPGVSFFLSLPGPANAMKAFDYMLETARCVVTNLSGELKDERRSDMTKQTIEHCRQRIKDFERRQLSLRL